MTSHIPGCSSIRSPARKIRLAEEIELEEVSPIPLVRVEPAPLLRAFRRVQPEVHAARAFGVFQQGNMLRRVVVYAVSVFAIHFRCFT